MEKKNRKATKEEIEYGIGEEIVREVNDEVEYADENLFKGFEADEAVEFHEEEVEDKKPTEDE